MGQDWYKLGTLEVENTACTISACWGVVGSDGCSWQLLNSLETGWVHYRTTTDGRETRLAKFERASR